MCDLHPAAPGVSTALMAHPIRITFLTLMIGGFGAALAWAIAMPAAILIGPAIALSLSSLAGVKTHIADPLRDLCFVVLGLGIGAGFDPNATAAILRWPLAFVVLCFGTFATLALSAFALRRTFGFDGRSATLAAAPGHLSFVLSIASDGKSDPGPIAVVQSIRLLLLTLIVPFIALIWGVQIPPTALPVTAPMGAVPLVICLLLGLAAGLLFRRLSLPAPLLLGPMVVSGIAHMSDLAPGSVPPFLLVPGFIVLGALIGTRFSGMPFARFRAALGAGIAVTLIGSVIAVIAAIPVALSLGMPLPQVLTAFAPGGIETMVALGAALGASPGFVAACHIVRLLILTVLIPLALRRPQLFLSGTP